MAENILKIFCITLITLIPGSNCQKSIVAQEEYVSGEDGDTTVADDTIGTDDTISSKYIFLFIGDGMGGSQVTLAQKALENEEFLPDNPTRELVFRDFNICGSMSTHAENRYITGSAAAGTAMATGHKTTIGTISMDGSRQKEYTTIAEMAKGAGWRVGIVTSVSIDHATPAAFYAHSGSRGNYIAIAEQMPESGFDYFAGASKHGGVKDIMIESGYRVVTDRDELMSLNGEEKVWAYNGKLTGDGSKSMLYTLDQPDSYTTLADFTEAGINILNNQKDFL